MSASRLGYSRSARRLGFTAALGFSAVLLAPPASAALAQTKPPPEAAGIAVRYSEGALHGFLELRSDRDSLLAEGDLLQVPGDSTIESRMVLRFVDKSLFEETTTYSQHQRFRLVAYHLVQRGPAFDTDLDATLSRDGRYVVTSRKGGKEDHDEGHLDLPGDVSNGLPVVIARNLRSGDTADVHLVAFTPEPRLIGLRIAFAGIDTVMVGGHAEPTARFVLSPQLGALTGFFAKLLGKLPPDSHVWIVQDQVPGFVRFEGPLFMGPVWRLSLAAPAWPPRRP
jgi:hypothetical protein